MLFFPAHQANLEFCPRLSCDCVFPRPAVHKEMKYMKGFIFAEEEMQPLRKHCHWKRTAILYSIHEVVLKYAEAEE